MLIALSRIIVKCLYSAESWQNIGIQLNLVSGLRNSPLRDLIRSFTTTLRMR
jgi:hypothetical protein